VAAAAVPITPAALARLVADRALALLDAGSRCPRVGIDGAVPSDTGGLADQVCALLSRDGCAVARVRAGDFLRPRSVRLEHGAQDPDSGYERWFDHHALRREVLDTLGPDGDLTWLPSLWDPLRDRATRAARRTALLGSILVLDGPFLLRWETADAVDVGVLLQASHAAMARRLDAADVARTVGAWSRYVEESRPQERADLVVRVEHPDRPALGRRPQGS